MIYGVTTNSFVDYPEFISIVAYTIGCNFRCPYCHNPGAVRNIPRTNFDIDILNNLITKNKGFVDALVISGGQPTIHGEKLFKLCDKAKDNDLKVKIDTNGSDPSLIKTLIDTNRIDYVAVDIKTIPTPEYYSKLCDNKDAASNVLATLEILRASTIDYEVRMPCINPFITVENAAVIKEVLVDKDIVYLNNFNREVEILDPSFYKDINPVVSVQELIDIQNIISSKVKTCILYN